MKTIAAMSVVNLGLKSLDRPRVTAQLGGRAGTSKNGPDGWKAAMVVRTAVARSNEDLYQGLTESTVRVG